MTIHAKLLNAIGKTLILALSLTCFSNSILAQDVWGLQKCIEYAKESNLSLKQAQYNVELAALTKKQNQLSRLPTVNGTASGGFQFGNTIDPVTNGFRNERITFNSFGLNASVPLYNGSRITKSIEQSGYDLKAAQADAQFMFNSTALNIANAYLQILMAEEQLANAQKRKTLSEAQLSQTDKLIQAGTLPENDRLEVVAQIARDEQTIIQAQNQIELNYLNLKQFMQLDPKTDIQIEIPEIEMPSQSLPYETSYSQVYETAMGTQPQIIRDEMNLKSSELDVDIARAGMLPQLVLFGGMDTRWSSASKLVDFVPNGEIDASPAFLDGNPVLLGFPDVDRVEMDNPYFDQLDQNFGQNVGMQLSIPFYNNGRNSVNMERAKVGILNSKVQSDLTKQQLKVDVQNAVAGARAAQRTLEASQKTVEAAQAAYANAEKQYELGAINTFQLTTARNNLDVAEIDQTVAKYDYIFRVKIIDFYLGKTIELN